MNGHAAAAGKRAASDRRLQSLAILIELEKRLREAENEQALAFLMVNETHGLAPYRQAVLWQGGGGTGRVAAVSGLALPDPNAPFTRWAGKAAASLDARGAGTEPHQVDSAELPDEVSRDWGQWLPAALLWIPLPGIGGLLLAREEPWSEAERRLLGYYAGACVHAWQALQSRRRRWWPQALRGRRVKASVLAAVLLLGFVPVHQTTLAPGEIIARDPVLVRAPVEGVVDEVAVQPNQTVTAGQVLLRLDGTRLANRLEVARKALEVAVAEYRQGAQQGLLDNRANAGLALLKGRVEQHEAEVAYLREMLDRITLRAPHGGIVIFDDVNDWLGRPVSVGERIMLVADPDHTELELRVPVEDAITLEEGARVRFFLNTDPHHPLEATLRYASYQAELTPAGVLAYRMVAAFPAESAPRRIGLQGSAKLYGQRTFLALYLLRRPLQALRQAVGI